MFFVYTAVCVIILFVKGRKKYSVVWLLVFATAAEIFICQQSLYSATVVSFEPWNKEQMEPGSEIVFGYPEIRTVIFIILVHYFFIHLEKENRYNIKTVKAVAWFGISGRIGGVT